MTLHRQNSSFNEEKSYIAVDIKKAGAKCRYSDIRCFKKKLYAKQSLKNLKNKNNKNHSKSHMNHRKSSQKLNCHK